MAAGGWVGLQPILAWTMDRLGYGSQVLPFNGGNVDIESFNSGVSTPVVSARYAPDQRIDAGFGRASFPEVGGTSPDQPAGLLLGQGVSDWALAMRLEGRAFWIAQAWAITYETPFTGSGVAWPMFQDSHTASLDQFGSMRVRAQSGQLQTAMVQNNGADTITYGVVLHDVDVAGEEDPGHAQLDAFEGNIVEFFIQATPNDPALSAETHKHNMSVWMRTRSATGASVLAPTLVTHYTPGASGANAWNARIEERFHMGRTIGDAANNGYRGDILGMAMGAHESSAMLTSATGIAAEMDRIWADIASMASGRGRVRKFY